MQRNSLSVSIVIPVYNEASELAACLDAIGKQSVAPFEVIVVDNNSTDNTVQIAQDYKFVSLLHEPLQGVVHARARGFNAAKGHIIARIDADSVVPQNWVQTVQRIFGTQNIDAVSGAAHYYNVAYSGMFNTIDLFFRRRLQRQLKDRVYLWGANMALRKSAWYQVQPTLCNTGGMHEDYDIAIHLQELDKTVVFDEELTAQVSSRRIDVGFVNFMRYVLVSPNTYAQHDIWRRVFMYEIAVVCALGYWPARLLHRGYDPEADCFSWLRLITHRPDAAARVDPTSHVA